MKSRPRGGGDLVVYAVNDSVLHGGGHIDSGLEPSVEGGGVGRVQQPQFHLKL